MSERRPKHKHDSYMGEIFYYATSFRSHTQNGKKQFANVENNLVVIR